MGSNFDQGLHLAEFADFVGVSRVEKHDVFLLELLDAISLLVGQLYVCVNKNRHFAAKLVQHRDGSLKRVERFQNPLQVHGLANLDNNAELVERVARQQVRLELEQALQEDLEPAHCLELDRHDLVGIFSATRPTIFACCSTCSLVPKVHILRSLAHLVLALLFFDMLDGDVMKT